MTRRFIHTFCATLPLLALSNTTAFTPATTMPGKVCQGIVVAGSVAAQTVGIVSCSKLSTKLPQKIKKSSFVKYAQTHPHITSAAILGGTYLLLENIRMAEKLVALIPTDNNASNDTNQYDNTTTPDAETDSNIPPTNTTTSEHLGRNVNFDDPNLTSSGTQEEEFLQGFEEALQIFTHSNIIYETSSPERRRQCEQTLAALRLAIQSTPGIPQPRKQDLLRRAQSIKENIQRMAALHQATESISIQRLHNFIDNNRESGVQTCLLRVKQTYGGILRSRLRNGNVDFETLEDFTHYRSGIKNLFEGKLDGGALNIHSADSLNTFIMETSDQAESPLDKLIFIYFICDVWQQKLTKDLENARTILGVGPHASRSSLKSTYRKLAKQHHPDNHGGDQEKFCKIQKAYETLMQHPAHEPNQYDNTTTPDAETDSNIPPTNTTTQESLGRNADFNDSHPTGEERLQRFVLGRFEEALQSFTHPNIIYDTSTWEKGEHCRQNLSQLKREIQSTPNIPQSWKKNLLKKAQTIERDTYKMSQLHLATRSMSPKELQKPIHNNCESGVQTCLLRAKKSYGEKLLSLLRDHKVEFETLEDFTRYRLAIKKLFEGKLNDYDLNIHSADSLKMFIMQVISNAASPLERLMFIYFTCDVWQQKLTKDLENARTILGVGPHADSSNVESAYNKLVEQHHPDNHGEDQAKLCEIHKAYETLRRHLLFHPTNKLSPSPDDDDKE